MRATLPVKKLQEIMDLMNKFVSRHATLPILENVYIKWGIDTIIFRATDMEKYIEIEMPVQLDDEGSITINAKTFVDILKTIDDDQINLVIEESNQHVIIQSSSDEFTIKWIPASEYVAIPEVQSDTPIKIDTSDFIEGINKVEYAVTEKNFSPVLTGVFMRIAQNEGEKELVFVGTDSFRLAEYKISYQGDGEELSMIVPKVHINDLKKVAEYALMNEAQEMTTKYANNMVEFTYQVDAMRIMCSSILIQGSFPDYQQESIIPTTYESKSLIDASQLEKAIKKIEILTRDMNNYILVSGEQDKVNLSSWQTDLWHADTSLSALHEGTEYSYGVNGKYITDCIKAVSWEEVVMRVIDSEKPIIFKDKDDENFTYVVRPLVK